MLDRHAAVGLLGLRQVGKTTLALEIARQRTSVYLDLMAHLLLVRRLPPWAENAGKRLVRSPKVYVRDSGGCMPSWVFPRWMRCWVVYSGHDRYPLGAGAEAIPLLELMSLLRGLGSS